MTFIKSLKMFKTKKAQASLEYFIIFSIVALLTILSFTDFLPRVQAALQGTSNKPGVFQRAVLTGLDVDNNGR